MPIFPHSISDALFDAIQKSDNLVPKEQQDVELLWNATNALGFLGEKLKEFEARELKNYKFDEKDLAKFKPEPSPPSRISEKQQLEDFKLNLQISHINKLKNSYKNQLESEILNLTSEAVKKQIQGEDEQNFKKDLSAIGNMSKGLFRECFSEHPSENELYIALAKKLNLDIG